MTPLRCALIGEGHPRLMERAMHPVGRDFRGFMAARSRYAEDRLAEAVANGVTQYVVLGAGLDTFAYRNPFPALRVFEVDFPATQEWKRAMLEEAAIALPSNLVFVALDFEHQTLADGLADAGPGFPEACLFRLAGCRALSHARCISRNVETWWRRCPPEVGSRSTTRWRRKR